MVNNKHIEREQARELRAQGVSIITIAKELGVSKGSVSAWVRDIELTPEQIQRLVKNQGNTSRQYIPAMNRDKAYLKRQEWQNEGRMKARKGNLLHMTGCMLYWTEGAKRRNSIIFVNSDPDMMCLFIQFLREALFVSDDMMKLQIHCHTHDEIEKSRIADYWLNLLRLTHKNLNNIHTKASSQIAKNVLQNGVCALTINSTQLAMHIYGAIQEYAGFDRPEWLF
jgi:plasmid maintenance system antidote protein VapI